MSDAPERIWACVSKNTKSGVVTLLGDATFPVDGWQEYVRADRIEALEAKLAKAVEALDDISSNGNAAGRNPQLMADKASATLAEISRHSKGESHE